MLLLPKALLRVAGKRRIPGEPDDAAELKAMIDAPVADRENWTPRWPTLEEYIVPIGSGRLCCEGNLGTVISCGRTLPLCVQVAEEIADERGETFDVIDLRSIFPYDWKMIKASVLKTGRVLIVNEDTQVSNFAEHLLRRIIEELFYDLEFRPRMLLGKHLPGIGLNPVYEMNSVPQLNHISKVMREMADGRDD